MKIKLANGCNCSEPQVYPSTWQRKNASIKAKWYIQFRFYDPKYKEQYPEGKQKVIKGMNNYHALTERQEATQYLLGQLDYLLKRCDFNFITGYQRPADQQVSSTGIDPETGLLDALQAAYKSKKATVDVKKDLRSVLKYVSLAAKEMYVDSMPIKDVGKRHLKALLEHTGKVKQRLENLRHNEARKSPKSTASALIKRDVWTANNFNFYRSHLMMLFDELCEWDIFEDNPVEKIKKESHKPAKRKTLTPVERIMVDSYLRKENYRLWLFIHIFFHSGARETEMMLVKKEDVNIKDQLVTYTILKGGRRREERVIKDIAVNYWEQALVGSHKGQYIFSRGLMPGNKPISPRQIGRRWKRWIKDRFPDIDADIYSLKHSNSTETRKAVGSKLAAAHNRHTEEVLRSNYDMDIEQQELELLKRVDNSFAPLEIKKPA